MNHLYLGVHPGDRNPAADSHHGIGISDEGQKIL